MKCLLDMDGVMVNFSQGIANWHGYQNGYSQRPLPTAWAGNWNMPALVGMPDADWYAPLGRPEFWAGLGWMPDGQRLLAEVEDYFGAENVCLLSNPGQGSGGMVGKQQWIANHMPQYSRRVLLGAATAKAFCAHGQSVLVDDRNENVELFWAAGGQAILVPRPWNRDYALADHCIPSLLRSRLHHLT